MSELRRQLDQSVDDAERIEIEAALAGLENDLRMKLKEIDGLLF